MTDEKKKDNPGTVTDVLCDAYREALKTEIKGVREVLKTEIKGLKDDMEKIDGRTWKILAGVIVTILLAIVSIAMNRP